jgi:hypothetical protein
VKQRIVVEILYSHIGIAEEVRLAHQKLAKLVIQDCPWNSSQRTGTGNPSQKSIRGWMEESDKREAFLLAMARPGDASSSRLVFENYITSLT